MNYRSKTTSMVICLFFGMIGAHWFYLGRPKRGIVYLPIAAPTFDRWGADRHGQNLFSDSIVAVDAKTGKYLWHFQALRHGVFCELGKGCVDFPAVLRWLNASGYSGYALVEQDILPGMGTPRESARRNREYLRLIEGNRS